MTKVSPRLQHRIVAFFEGTLSEREQRELERHLRRSDSLRREFEAYRRLRELSTPPRVEYPSEYAMAQFLPRLHARIERELAFRSRRTTSLWWQRGLLGLGVVEACAAILLLVWGLRLENKVRGNAVSSEVQVATTTLENEPLMFIAETWVTPKLASRLASINPEGEVYASLSESTSSVTTLPETETRNVSSTPTDGNVSESYRRLIEVSLPPPNIYSEEAFYLLAAGR